MTDVVEKMKPGTYESYFWQHYTKIFVFAEWLTMLLLRRCQIITV